MDLWFSDPFSAGILYFLQGQDSSIVFPSVLRDSPHIPQLAFVLRFIAIRSYSSLSSFALFRSPGLTQA